MESSLEVRVPFCDYRIVEYAYNMPWSIKSLGGREKGILRKAFENELPDIITRRKKSPYPKTFDPRYTELITAQFREMASQNAPVWELVRKETLMELLEGTSPWPWYGQLMRNPQIMAYFLQLDFWLRHYNVDICL